MVCHCFGQEEVPYQNHVQKEATLILGVSGDSDRPLVTPLFVLKLLGHALKAFTAVCFIEFITRSAN